MKIPKNEILWETIISKTGKEYILTSPKDRSKYILYLNKDGVLEKVATGKTPPDVENKIK